jgi:hypothetical protein
MRPVASSRIAMSLDREVVRKGEPVFADGAPEPSPLVAAKSASAIPMRTAMPAPAASRRRFETPGSISTV